jgi:phosphoglycerate dehydrogenase-like enzyme
MNPQVVCLRPEDDFLRAGMTPPPSLHIAYHAPEDPELPALMSSARGLLIGAVGPNLPAALFQQSKLELVQVTGAGVDRLDAAALQRLGIPVCNVPGGSRNAVAEYAVTAASLLLRRFHWASAEIQAGNYAQFRRRIMLDNPAGLDGLTVGVVGLGTLGLAAAQAFHARGCAIVYFDPAPRESQATAAIGARSVTLNTLLGMSDVVTLHMPLMPQTRDLIGERELAMMKPGAVLIQAARGGIVDEAALSRSLESGHLGGAAVDVYSQEPPPRDNPLLALSGEAARRLLLTPHVAGITRQSQAILFRSAFDNLERVLLRGEAPLNRVY